MGAIGNLVSVILFLFLNLLLLQMCHSRLLVDMKVSGSYVVKTGIGTYTSLEGSRVLITCTSQMSVNGTILLLNKTGENVVTGDALEDGKKIAWLRTTYPKKRYRCMLNISTWISNLSFSEFSVMSEVEIKTVSTVSYTEPLCASSIGNVGYVGETVTLTCHFNYHWSCFNWENTNKNRLEIVLSGDFLERSCRCHYNEPCSSSIFVAQSLYINVSMIDNGNLSNNGSVMKFLCMSTPPRLMYWKVFGTYGNLLDFDNIGQQVNVNTTVNITQSPGKTFLRISETISGGNGIHTVMCSTYDTEKRVVAFLPIKTPSENSFDFEQSTFKTTDIQESTPYNPTKTDVHSTLAVTTTENGDEVSKEQGDLLETDIKIDNIDNFFLVGFVSLPYLVVISILLGSICFMRYRDKNNMQTSIAVPSQHIPSETILHENPAYLSFSETKNYTSENEDTEKTYANL